MFRGSKPSSTSPPLPREGFLLSPLRNSTKDTTSILYTRGGTNPRHKAYAQSNHLYIRGKAQNQITKHKAKEWLQHLVITKITNNTSHNIRSLIIDFAMNTSSLWENKYFASVTPRFPKYARAETRHESAKHIREENTSHIRAKPKVTWTSYKSKP